MSHPDQHQAIDEILREEMTEKEYQESKSDEREFPFTGPLARAHREHLITKLVDHLVEHVDMEGLIQSFYEDQYKYFDKEATFPELIDWLRSTDTITRKEANEIEKNGF